MKRQRSSEMGLGALRSPWVLLGFSWHGLPQITHSAVLWTVFCAQRDTEEVSEESREPTTQRLMLPAPQCVGRRGGHVKNRASCAKVSEGEEYVVRIWSQHHHFLDFLTLGKSFNLIGPQCPHLPPSRVSIPSFIGSDKIMCKKFCILESAVPMKMVGGMPFQTYFIGS